MAYSIENYFTRNRYAAISKALKEDQDDVKAKIALADDLDETIIHTLNPDD